MIRTPVLAMLTILLAASFAGCMHEDEGRVTVYVKDAATDEFSELFITFSKVSIHAGDEDEEPAEGEEPDTEGAGWETVFEGSKEIDLLAFSGADARAFLGDANLSAGTYDQIVITVDDARGIRADDGSEVGIEVTTGWVRVVRAFEVNADQTTRLILDLDLDRSVVQQGPTGWRLNPVIGQVIVQEGATGSEGSISGRATDGGQNGGQTGGQDGTGTGTMTTYVKDQPTEEFSEIWIRFDAVTVHRAGDNETENGGNETDNETGNETEEGSWVVVFDGDRAIDLLRFSEEGSKAFLGSDELAAGRYTQIRINITEAWGIRASDDQNVTITVANTEAKVVRTFEVEANATTQVVIDLDLDRSIRQQGTQGWRMTPVIGSVQVERVENDPQADVPDQA